MLGVWFASRSRFELAPVLGLTLVDGVIALTARAIPRATTVAVIAPAGLLREGNALTNASFSVCFMAGPAIGGAIVAIGGTMDALFMNSVLFVAVAVTIAMTRGLPVPTTSTTARPVGSAPPSRLREHPLIRTLLSVQAIAVLFFTISIPVEIVLAQRSFHGGAGGYGALVSAWGVGAVAGSGVYARWRRLPARMLIVLGAAMLGAGFLVMATAPSLAIVVAGAALAGIGNGVFVVALRTTLQESTEARWMAIIMSLSESIFQTSTGVGIVVGGVLAAIAGPRAALAVGGAVRSR